MPQHSQNDLDCAIVQPLREHRDRRGCRRCCVKLSTVASILTKPYIWLWKKGFCLLGRTIYQLIKVHIQRQSHQLILFALLPFSWQWKIRAQQMLFASIKQLFKNKLQACTCQRDNANGTGSMTSLWLRAEVKSIHSLTSLQILHSDPLTDSTSICNVWLLSLQLCISNRTLNAESRCWFLFSAIYIPSSKIGSVTLPLFQLLQRIYCKKNTRPQSLHCLLHPSSLKGNLFE